MDKEETLNPIFVDIADSLFTQDPVLHKIVEELLENYEKTKDKSILQ